MDAHKDGGGLIGTPLDALPAPRSASHAHRRLSAADRLAPPAGAYARRREVQARNAERDSLRDVYRPPPIGLAARGGGDCGGVMDDEDRMNALRRARKRPDGVAGSAGRDGAAGFVAAGDAAFEVFPARSRVSIGHALLRAEGFSLLGRVDGDLGGGGLSASGGTDSTDWGAERRRKYRLGDLFAAVEQGNVRRRAGVGCQVSTSGDGDGVFDGASLSRGGFVGGEPTSIFRGGGHRHDDVCDLSLVDDADIDSFGPESGSLGAAASRMGAALEKSRASRAQGGAESVTDLDGEGGHRRSVIDMFDRGEDLHRPRSEWTELPAVSDTSTFGVNFLHDWRTDKFRAGVTAECSEEPYCRSAARVAEAELKKISALGTLLEARHSAARDRQEEDLRRVRASAGAALKSSFVSAGTTTSSRNTEESLACEPTGAEVGDTRRKSYGWEPEAIICKRLNIIRPTLPTSAEREPEVGVKRFRASDVEQWTGEGAGAGQTISFGGRLRRHSRSNDIGGESASGVVRITSVVSRNGQVTVIGRGTDDEPPAVLIEGEMGELVSSDDCDDEEDESNDVDSPAEEARRLLRSAVFEGKHSQSNPSPNAEVTADPPGTIVQDRRRWLAADFF